jgi:pimeloyl-ACP methyl ester carboxylesterase
VSTISHETTRIKGFSDTDMEFQLLRQLGASNYRASSVGECITIANTVKNDNPEEWVNAFEELAEWQKNDGMERLVKGHVISGREQLFKASNSFRAAEFYSPCHSEMKAHLGLNSADCFSMAISSMDIHFENHSIPYHNINLPAYFISPANDGVKRKTILIISGYDGTMEEEFLTRGIAAVERGYNVIHFAGPGQMDVIRNYPESHFEPDFEHVIKKIINHFAFRHEVDMSTLAIMGISFGGYFAIRAAAYDSRIKVLIANSPLIDWYAYLCECARMDDCQMSSNELTDLEAISGEAMLPQLKLQIESLMKRLGQESFKACFNYAKQFNVKDALVNIKIPTLALIGSAESTELKNQFQQFCKEVDSEYYEFSNFEGAGNHCQVGNVSFSNAVVYDWLDNIS